MKPEYGKISRMSKRGFWYYRVLPAAVAVFFSLMLFGTLTDFYAIAHPAWIPLWATELAGVIVYALVVIFILGKLQQFLSKKKNIRPRVEKKFLLIFFAALLLVQIGFATQMSVPMQPQCFEMFGVKPVCFWDFQAVAQGAADLVNGNLKQFTVDYLHAHQNNISAFALLGGVFKLAALVGITNFHAVGIGLNILLICTTLFMIYLVIRHLFGTKKAIFSLAIATMLLPLSLLYVPVFYTDTLTLLFPITILYLYLRLRKTKALYKYLLLFAAMILLTFVGSVIKFSVMIVLVAIIIDMIMRSDKKDIKRLVLAFSCLLLFIPLFMVYGALTDKYVHSRASAHIITTPPTHYIMMGLAGNGQYSMADDANTLMHETQEEAIKYNIQEIKKRLSDHGALGYTWFLFHKARDTWNDGSYESTEQLRNNSLLTEDYSPSALQRAITSYKTYPLTLLNYLTAVHVILLLAIIIGSFKRRYKNIKELAVFRLAVFGLALFLLVWETNSRYLVNFLPLIAVLSVPVLWQIAPQITNKMIGGYLTARRKVLKY